MHFIISWDIKAVQDARKKEIDDALKNCLKTYSWVRPLESFYVVKVDSKATWDSILACMTAVGRTYGNEVNFIFSPLMQGGEYNGWLPETTWPEIRTRST